MKTKVSTKGQVVIPEPLRRRLGVRAGDALDIRVEDGRIVLIPKLPKAQKARIVYDPESGLPALDAGPDAPVLTNEMVKELLADFP